MEGAGRALLAGVYIPPANSAAGRVRYASTLDDLAEAVATLALRHAVSREAQLFMGDFNVHVGTRACGHPPTGPLCSDHTAPQAWYTRERFSSCQGRSVIWRGDALHRACTRHGWLVLNGRAVSDRLGAATCHHLATNTVLDLAICPHSALGDVRVLPPLRADGHWHTAIFAAVLLTTV